MPRPKKQIDIEQLEKLAEKQWSIEQIAAFFRVSRDTIERRYAANVKEARQRGTAKIIDLQWKRALEGSDTMIKHMSQHYIGQYDKQKIEINKISDEELSEEIKRRLNESGNKNDL